MITMEMDVTSSINNNDVDHVTYHVTNLIRELEQQLSGMAKLVEKFFEKGLPYLISAHGGTPLTPSREILIVRFKTFYTAFTGLLECFNLDKLTCLVPIGEKIGKDSFDVSRDESWKYVTILPDDVSSNYTNNIGNNNSCTISSKEIGADKENKTITCKRSSPPPSPSSSSSPKVSSSSSSPPRATITSEVSRKKAVRPKTLFTSNINNPNSSTSTANEANTSSSSSSQMINQSTNQSINQFIQKANIKHAPHSRKTSRRFVTTCVTGAEIAAAYQTLAAATFRMSDFGRQEKIRHASFVSRGTSTPRKKDEFFFSWLTQSLPHLETGVGDGGRFLPSASHSHSQQILDYDHHHQQQQTQTTSSTRDASTSFDFIPRANKGVQVCQGEILEPADRMQAASTTSKLDRHKKRQNSRVQLQKIIEEPEDCFEDVPSKYITPPLSMTSRRFLRRHTISTCAPPFYKSCTCATDSAHSESKQKDELYLKKSIGNFPCFSSFEGSRNILWCGPRGDTPQTSSNTIDYFFKQ